jgi:uncharacterized protein YndB with AHSA1/START domain
MSSQQTYTPGQAEPVEVQKDGDTWTLALVRVLRHPPEKVWEALTEPTQLQEWAPFDADQTLGVTGASANLTIFGTPHVTQTVVTRADPPKTLEYNWAGGPIRWELEPVAEGTLLKLWASIDRRYIAMGAAGWHICLDVLAMLLGGTPVGRMAGPDTMRFEGWQRLNKEYAEQFGI